MDFFLLLEHLLVEYLWLFAAVLLVEHQGKVTDSVDYKICMLTTKGSALCQVLTGQVFSLVIIVLFQQSLAQQSFYRNDTLTFLVTRAIEYVKSMPLQNYALNQALLFLVDLS